MTALLRSHRRQRALALVAVVLGVAAWLTWTSAVAGADESPIDTAVQGVAGAFTPSSEAAPSTTSTTAAPATSPAPRPSKPRRAATSTGTAPSTTSTTAVFTPYALASNSVSGFQAVPQPATYQRQPYPSAVIPKGGVGPAENPGVHPVWVTLIAFLSALAGGAAVGAIHRRPAFLSRLPWLPTGSVEEPAGVDAADVPDERREELVAK